MKLNHIDLGVTDVTVYSFTVSIAKDSPMEEAVELNQLIELEPAGSVG